MDGKLRFSTRSNHFFTMAKIALDKKQILNEIKGYLGMVLGCLAYGLGTSLFLKPNLIVSGGITGLAVIINHLTDFFSVGTLVVMINLPILLVGIKLQGWKFICRCLLTVATLGLMTDLLEQIPSFTDDSILASLYGGICQGVGLGLFIKYEFSSGGTELLGRYLARVIKSLKISVGTGIFDACVVVWGAFVNSPDNILYALIVIFVTTKVSEIVIMGLEKSKLCIIITDKGKEISKTLLEKSPRGVTMLNGYGMYTERERDVILTCVKNRQLTQLKEIVKSIDDHAFIIINDSVEVRGQGFQSLIDP